MEEEKEESLSEEDSWMTKKKSKWSPTCEKKAGSGETEEVDEEEELDSAENDLIESAFFGTAAGVSRSTAACWSRFFFQHIK